MKVDDLISTKTWQDVVDELITATAQRTPLTNFNTGSVIRTLLEAVAQPISELHDLVKSVFSQVFIQTATGSWLDLKAQEMGVERIQASYTTGKVTFQRTDTQGALTIPAGTIVATQVYPDGSKYRFFTVADAVMADGEASVDVDVKAEHPGADYNLTAGTITVLETAISGVDFVTNGADWLTSAGVDEETDDSLRERLLARWQEIGTGSTKAAYEYWAKSVSGVADVLVLDDFPRGPGTVDVVISGPDGLPGPDVVDQVNSTIQANRPICSDVLVRAANAVDIQVQVTASASPDATDLTSIQSAIQSAIQGLTWRIGEDFRPARIIAAAMGVEDVVDVACTPADTVSVADDGLVIISSLDVTVTQLEEL